MKSFSFNKLLSFLAFGFLFVGAQAQISDQQKSGKFPRFIDLGLQVNSTTYSDKNTIPKLGMEGHIFLNVASSGRLELQLGSEFRVINLRKRQIQTNQLQWFENADFTIKYFSIPINFNIYLDKKQRFQLRSGIFTDLRMSAKYSGLKTYYHPSQGWIEARTTETPNLKPYNAGIKLGFYAQIFEIKRVKLRLGGNWFYRPLGISNEQYTIKLSTASLGLSAFF